MAFEAIDEIAIVAAPGVESVRNDLAAIANDWEIGSPSSIAEERIQSRALVPYRRITPTRLSTSHGLRCCTRQQGKKS